MIRYKQTNHYSWNRDKVREYYGVFLKYANKYGYDVIYAQYGLAMSIFESGWFKSNNAITRKNIIGMRCVKKRPTTQISCSENNWGIYRSHEECIEDYYMWLNYNNAPKMQENFNTTFEFFKQKNYFTAKEADNYYNRFAPVFNQLFTVAS